MKKGKAPKALKTYKMALKYPVQDILEPEWGFQAESQKQADDLAWGWNRHHGHCDCPGYGYAIAVETTERLPIHNEWVY